jgi:hypothetical protein
MDRLTEMETRFASMEARLTALESQISTEQKAVSIEALGDNLRQMVIDTIREAKIRARSGSEA